MRRVVLHLGLALLVLSGVCLAEKQGSPEDLEKRARQLEYQLRCVMCQGESIAESPSRIAGTMRKKVRHMVVQGKSDQEILDYFVGRYGEFVLMEPKNNPRNWPLWFGPGVLVVLGAMLVIRLFKKRTPVFVAPASPLPVDVQALEAAKRLLEKGEPE